LSNRASASPTGYTYKFIPYYKKPDCRFAIEINKKGRAFSDPAFEKRHLVISSFDRPDGESGLHFLKSRKDIKPYQKQPDYSNISMPG